MAPDSGQEGVVKGSDDDAFIEGLKGLVARQEAIVPRLGASVAKLSKKDKLRRRDRVPLGDALLSLRSHAAKVREVESRIARRIQDDNAPAVSESLRRLAVTNSEMADAADALIVELERLLNR